MHRLSSICRLGAGAAILASLSSTASAQEPMPMPPGGGSGIMAPRTDAYSVYTDAFYNSQQRASAGAATAEAVSGLWRNPNRIHIYGGVDMLLFRRSKASNRDLVTVTQNVFFRDPTTGLVNNAITNPDFLGPGIDPNNPNAGADLYPGLNAQGNYYAGSSNGIGVVYPSGPNTPGAYQRVAVGFGANGVYYSPKPSGLALPNPQVYTPAAQRANENSPVDQTIVSNAIPDGAISPGQVLMKTDDFDNGQRVGYRPKIGLEFENGDRLEFSYMWFNDFKAPTLVKDVSGSAFLMHQLYDTGGGTISGNINQTGSYYYYQRFGYLTSPFNLTLPGLPASKDPTNSSDPNNPAFKFVGERRLLDGVNATTAPVPPNGAPQQTRNPHNPTKEVPQPGFGTPAFPQNYANPTFTYPYPGSTPNQVVNGVVTGPANQGTFQAPYFTTLNTNGIRSASVPREPTVDDTQTSMNLALPAAVVASKYGSSFLWQDGEMAVANYSFDIQGGELMYKHVYSPDWAITGWQLNLVGGIRHVNLNEMLGFFFADIAGEETAAASGVAAQYPYDRAKANPDRGPLNVAPQPSIQTEAMYTNTVRNTMLSPEVGVEANFPFWSYFEFNVAGRGGFAANFLTARHTLIRADGYQYMDYQKSILGSGGIIEGLLGGTFRPLPNVAIRGGFEYLLLMNVGTGVSNIQFNLPQVNDAGQVINGRRPAHNDSVLFTGWTFGAEVAY